MPTAWKLNDEQRKEIAEWAAARARSPRTRDGGARALAARLGVCQQAIYHHARLRMRKAALAEAAK